MNDPHSLTDGGKPKTEGGLLFGDWNLSEEKTPTDYAPMFDGKIIARMPDLGSVSIAKTAKTPEFPSFWGQVRMSVLSTIQACTSDDATTRQRFFRHITVFGGIVLLCGIGILFLTPGKDKTPERAIDVAEISAETTGNTATKPVASPFTPVMQPPFAHPETSNAPPSVASIPTIPVAPVESVAAVSPPSPWARTVNDPPTSWTPPPRPPSEPFPPNNIVAVPPVPPVPPGPPDTVAMTPMTPLALDTASMPVSPHEMSVSPLDMQLIAQSNHSPVPPGMMLMHGRQENMPGMAPQQYQPATPGHAASNNPYGQVGQPNQYVVPPGYMSPPQQAAPTDVPIPIGGSTLPHQGGQYEQPFGMPPQNIQPLGTPPIQRIPSDFYNPIPTNPMPTSRVM